MKKKNEVKLNDRTLEEVLSSDFPSIYIHEMEDKPDGDCIMTFETNAAFNTLYKETKNRKRVTQKGLGNYILELLQKSLDKKDGYDLKTIKKKSDGKNNTTKSNS